MARPNLDFSVQAHQAMQALPLLSRIAFRETGPRAADLSDEKDIACQQLDVVDKHTDVIRNVAWSVEETQPVLSHPQFIVVADTAAARMRRAFMKNLGNGDPFEDVTIPGDV